MLLSLVAGVALFGFSNGQTTTYLDFEGTAPTQFVFGGSDFAIVENPSKVGNLSDMVATTKKGEVSETWGGVAFPLGGTINFAPTEQVFSVDVFSYVAGIATFKVEQGAQGAVEIKANYTTPGYWETLTYTFVDRNPDYKQIVVFMGFETKDTDEWFYDNVKGPGFTAGGPVDVTFNVTDLGGTATSVEVALSDAPATKIALTGEAGEGAVWTTAFTGMTGGTILVPSTLTYTIYVNGEAVEELTDLAMNIMAGSAPVTIAKNYGSAPSGTSVLNNGSFDGIEGPLVGRTGTEWGSWTGNGGAAEITGGVVTVTPVQAGDNWNMQIEQLGFPLANGTTYTVTFDAWAATERVIALTIEDPINGYALLGTSPDAASLTGRSKWEFIISTTRTTYTVTTSIDGMKDNTQTKFAFLLAQTADMVYLDDVTLIAVEPGVAVENSKVNSVKLYPNPAVNDLYLSSSTSYNKAVVYNMLGAKVKEVSNVSRSINVSELKSGVYMIRLTSVDGETFTSKFMKK